MLVLTSLYMFGLLIMLDFLLSECASRALISAGAIHAKSVFTEEQQTVVIINYHMP